MVPFFFSLILLVSYFLLMRSVHSPVGPSSEAEGCSPSYMEVVVRLSVRPAGCSMVREVGMLKTQVSHCSKDFWSACYPHSWALSQECN